MPSRESLLIGKAYAKLAGSYHALHGVVRDVEKPSSWSTSLATDIITQIEGDRSLEYRIMPLITLAEVVARSPLALGVELESSADLAVALSDSLATVPTGCQYSSGVTVRNGPALCLKRVARCKLSVLEPGVEHVEGTLTVGGKVPSDLEASLATIDGTVVLRIRAGQFYFNNGGIRIGLKTISSPYSLDFFSNEHFSSIITERRLSEEDINTNDDALEESEWWLEFESASEVSLL